MSIMRVGPAGNKLLPTSGGHGLAAPRSLVRVPKSPVGSVIWADTARG